jgi:hypothetical protein
MMRYLNLYSADSVDRMLKQLLKLATPRQSGLGRSSVRAWGKGQASAPGYTSGLRPQFARESHGHSRSAPVPSENSDSCISMV